MLGLGRRATRNSLPPKPSRPTRCVGLQHHPTGDSGRLPLSLTSPSGIAARAGKALSAAAGLCPSSPPFRPHQPARGLSGPPSGMSAESPLPAPYRVGRRGAAPTPSFCRTRFARRCGRTWRGSPDRTLSCTCQAAAWTGAAPPLSPCPAATRCARRWRLVIAKVAPPQWLAERYSPLYLFVSHAARLGNVLTRHEWFCAAINSPKLLISAGCI